MSDAPFFIHRKTVEADQRIANPIREIVNQLIDERAMPEVPAYFVHNRWLVTYDHLIEVRNHANFRINQLEQRIAQLERPWWRRWLNR